MDLNEAKKRVAAAKGSGASELDLSRCGLRQLPLEDLKAISEQLTSLNIIDNQIGDEGAVAISQYLKNLKNLYIRNNNIGDIGAIAIGKNLKNLINLDIRFNNIGNEGLVPIGQNMKNLTNLDVGENNVGDEGAAAISEKLENLKILDIRYNNIGDLGAKAISQNLKNLTNLNISRNKIGDEGVIAISQNLKNLEKLNISHNNISDGGISAVSQNLKNLTNLNISRNKIGDEGIIAISQNLKNLTDLFIYNINISLAGIVVIGRGLKNLRSLNIADNNIGDEAVSTLSQSLKNLTNLNVSNNEISCKGAAVISQDLPKLTNLDIGDNDIGNEGATSISQSLKNLTNLDISGNNISFTGAAVISLNLQNLTNLYISRNKIGREGATAIAKNLKNLRTLFISDNNIGDEGATAIAKNLKNLKDLYTWGNNIGDEGVVAICEHLKNLTDLFIRSNGIGDKGAVAISQNLRNLTKLDISNNQIGDEGIKSIYTAYKDNLQIDIVFSSDQIETIPPSATESWGNLKQYFASIATENTVILNALNILLLGNTFSGKSSMQKFYLDNGKKFLEISQKNRTWGITHKVVDSKLSSRLRLSFWDFGGQEYFHGTHRLFIGGRNALYLVLWESQFEAKAGDATIINMPLKNDNGDDCYPAAYWLGTIRHFEREADVGGIVMVVQSKIDTLDHQSDTWPVFLTNKRFGLHPENCFNLSIRGASDKGAVGTRDYYKALWAVFKNRFEQLILEQKSTYEFNEDMLKILGDEGLIKWRREKGLSLPKQEFLGLCHQFYKGADDFIMKYLQDCGEILLFEDNARLKDSVFIDTEALLNSIYTVLNKKVKDKGGVFGANEMKGKKTLVDVMLEMDLVFENPAKEGEYIAPQFMNENAEISKLLGHLRRLLKIAFSLRFPDFMPRGYITRFISQKGKLSVDGVYWKYGVLYNYETSGSVGIKVLVEADENNRFIRVYVDDKPGKYEALKEVFNSFAFYDNPIDGYKTIPGMVDSENLLSFVEKEMASFDKEPADYLELSADGQSYAAIEEIDKAIDASASKVRDINGGYMPLDSIFYVLLNKITTMPKKIFFSYSRHDRQYREEFDIHFATLKRQGLIATWYDGVIEPGSDANAEIMKELENADIILCLLSPNFMANDYIWNIEMQKAKDAKKVIVPITLRACDYKKYFADYFGEDKQGFLTQKQFNKGQEDEKTKERDIIWIASEQHAAKRDEYYNFIVEGLKRIIER